MYRDWFYLQQSRMLRERELAERIAERRRLAELRAGRPSPRARMARYLFALAVAAEREETWKIVWEKLEAKGRL